MATAIEIGLRIGLRDIYAKYRLPIMVVENGFGMRDILEIGRASLGKECCL